MSPTGRWLRCLLLLGVGFHLVFGLLRLPGAAYAKRLERIRQRQALGELRFHLEFSPESVPAVEWLRTHTPPDAVVLFRGDWRGPLEFAAALLHPRLLHAEGAWAPGAATVYGRPLAHGRLAEGEPASVVVLVAERDRPLRLERSR